MVHFQTRSRLTVLILVSSVFLASSGCWRAVAPDLRQPCETDDECPDDAPFCDDGRCIADEPCVDQCDTPGAEECLDRSTLQRCERVGDCLVEVLEGCPSGTACSDGACAEVCLPDCDGPQQRCVSDESAVERCVADEDGCHGYVSEPCDDGLICVGAGRCDCDHDCTTQGDLGCHGNRPKVCETNDQGCRDWDLQDPCPDGETCDRGVCIPGCADDVCVEDDIVCPARNVPLRCERDEETGCTAWVGAETCGIGTRCEPGRGCVSSCDAPCLPEDEGDAACRGANQYEICLYDAVEGCHNLDVVDCDPGESCSNTCESLCHEPCSWDDLDACETDTSISYCDERRGCRQRIYEDCPSGEVCLEGGCEVLEDACGIGDGDECRGDVVVTCTDVDADGFNEWAELIECTDGLCLWGMCLEPCIFCGFDAAVTCLEGNPTVAYRCVDGCYDVAEVCDDGEVCGLNRCVPECAPCVYVGENQCHPEHDDLLFECRRTDGGELCLRPVEECPDGTSCELGWCL